MIKECSVPKTDSLFESQFFIKALRGTRCEPGYLNMPSPIEFQFVDMRGLNNEEIEFLSPLLFKADAVS